MHQLSVYLYTQGGTAAFTLQDMTAVADPSVSLTNNHVFPPNPAKILCAYGMGEVDIIDFQITTPRLRAIALPHMFPVDAAVAPVSRTWIPDMRKHPISVMSQEEISLQMSGSVGTLNTFYFGAIWWTENWIPAPMGDVYTVRVTSTITQVTNGWANGIFTLQNPLPAGTYSVVGMHAFGANLAFARLAFPNQVRRPGIIAGVNAAYVGNPIFRQGELGEFGQFNTYSLPQLDTFGLGAGAAQTAFIDLVKVA